MRPEIFSLRLAAIVESETHYTKNWEKRFSRVDRPRFLDINNEVIVEFKETTKSEIERTRKRRLIALALHWLIRPLGYLEFTDIYFIRLFNLPPLFDVHGYTIEKATAGDIDEIARVLKRDEPSAVLRSLWNHGHHCFVAKYAGSVIAYNWVSFSPVQEEEYLYTPKEDHVICVDAYTAPDHRGKGLHLLLLLTMLHFAAASGKRLAYTGVSLLNLISWKTHLRIGWTLDFTFVWFRPNFTLKRHPWRITRERYPLRLNWAGHTWLTAGTR
jgi:GNAT superfamily N-acetyltransferase